MHVAHETILSRRPALLLLLTAVCVAGPWAKADDQAEANIEPHAGMMRYPDVSQTEIVFVYANDLWVVSRDGGQARPLASPAGAEMFPKFSPDGSQIAFVGNYDGNVDLYTILSQGGSHELGGRLLAECAAPELASQLVRRMSGC